MIITWGVLLKVKALFRSWRLLAVLAVFWFAELVLQSSWLALAGDRPASLAHLVLPALLVMFFALGAGAAYAQARLRARRFVDPSSASPVPRPNVAQIRAELRVLGQERLDGVVGDEEFRTRRDNILQPVIYPASPQLAHTGARVAFHN